MEEVQGGGRDVCVCAGGSHLTDRETLWNVLTWGEGQGRQLCVFSRANVGLDRVHAGSPQADEHFPGAASRKRAGHRLENARIPEF